MLALAEFSNGEHRELSVPDARAFGMEDWAARSQCSAKWLAAVNGMPSGSIVEGTTVRGKVGTGAWYRMQSAGDGRGKNAELIRPGPRYLTSNAANVK